MIRRASANGIAKAMRASGIFKTAPAGRRLTLPPPNTSGFRRKRATSIWSSETSAGKRNTAISLAVSPGWTSTSSPRASPLTEGWASAPLARTEALSASVALERVSRAGAIAADWLNTLGNQRIAAHQRIALKGEPTFRWDASTDWFSGTMADGSLAAD
jgi:hypothetical protein